MYIILSYTWKILETECTEMTWGYDIHYTAEFYMAYVAWEVKLNVEDLFPSEMKLNFLCL